MTFLVDSYMTENERFDMVGADAAVEFLRQWDLSEAQLDTVWDAIALHTSIGIDEVLSKFPRLGFKAEATRTVLHVCERKPSLRS